MGNFCTKCGKPLADGEVCNCQGAAPQIDPAQQAAPQQQSAAVQQQYQQAPQQQYQQAPQQQYQQAPQQQYQQAPQQQYQQVPPQQQYQQVPPQQYQQQYQQMAPQQSAASDYFKQFLNTALNVWKKPVTAGKEYVMSGKFTLAIGYLIVQAVLAVILGMVFEARSSLANLAEFAGSSVGVTYVKVFFGTLFLSAIFSIMLAGLLLGFNLIAKNNMTFKNALCLASVRSIVIAPAMVVALIIILINPAWGGVFSLIINIWGFVAIVKALPVVSEQSDNLLVHLVTAAILIFVIIALIIMFTIGLECYCPGVMSEIKSALGMFSGSSSRIKNYW